MELLASIGRQCICSSGEGGAATAMPKKEIPPGRLGPGGMGIPMEERLRGC